MKIYRVIPMGGIEFKTKAEALVSLEAGHVWLCTGWAQIHGGAVEKSTTFVAPIRVRTDGSTLAGVGLKADGWLVKWKAGKRACLQYVRKPGPPAPERVDNKLTAPPSPAPRVRRNYEADKILLRAEMRDEGSWLTSGGKRFRPFQYNEDIGVNNFPMVVWEQGDGPRAEMFDPDLNCRTAGDRELERWYESAKRRAYNAYAKKLSSPAGGGGFNGQKGNTRTPPAPDPDQIKDTGPKFHDWAGHIVT